MNNTEMYVAVRNQDALEYCKKQSMLEQMVGDEKWRHYEYAAKALEKQILKTPICKKYSDDTRCPICNTFVLYGNKHCIECGQALDWSEIE